MESSSWFDYLDEEVVDRDGHPIGTLGCYWESAPDVAAFLGVEVKRDTVVRVVPVRCSEKNERHSCITLRFSAQKVETAPGWDCSMELDAFLQEKVNLHFGLVDAKLQPGLKHFTRPSRPPEETDSKTNESNSGNDSFSKS